MRIARVTLVVCSLLAAQVALAQSRPTAVAPSHAPARAATTAVHAPSRAPVRPRRPAAHRPATTPTVTVPDNDLLRAGATMAQQVLTGVVAPSTVPSAAPTPDAGAAAPLNVPLDDLLAAGLNPARLPGALGPALQSPGTQGLPLAPAQLTQLGQLASQGLSSQQLQSVATALSQGGTPTTPAVLSPAQLGRLTQLAQQGAGLQSLTSALTSMLGAH